MDEMLSTCPGSGHPPDVTFSLPENRRLTLCGWCGMEFTEATVRAPQHNRPIGQPRPFSELRETGLLWLINRVVFHPRGYALAFSGDEAGWSLLGDGTEIWTMPEEIDDMMFAKVKELLK